MIGHRYPGPDPIGGRAWCVELRRRITGLVPAIAPPAWPQWPERPGMYNARDVAGGSWDRRLGWTRHPSSHAYCDGDDYMVTHLAAPQSLRVGSQVAWIAAVMLAEQHPILPAGYRSPAFVVEVIWNRHIITLERLADGWRPYTGRDPHVSHPHLTIVRPGSPLHPYPPARTA